MKGGPTVFAAVLRSTLTVLLLAGLVAGCDSADPLVEPPAEAAPVVLAVEAAPYGDPATDAPGAVRLTVRNEGAGAVEFVRAGYAVEYVVPGAATGGGDPVIGQSGQARPLLAAGAALAPGASASVTFDALSARPSDVRCLSYVVQAYADRGSLGADAYDLEVEAALAPYPACGGGPS